MESDERHAERSQIIYEHEYAHSYPAGEQQMGQIGSEWTACIGYMGIGEGYFSKRFVGNHTFIGHAVGEARNHGYEKICGYEDEENTYQCANAHRWCPRFAFRAWLFVFFRRSGCRWSGFGLGRGLRTHGGFWLPAGGFRARFLFGLRLSYGSGCRLAVEQVGIEIV